MPQLLNNPNENSTKTKKVAVFNDISGFGRCSLTAAIAVLSVMGVQACPIPTAVLTNQSEFKYYYCVDMTEHLPYYAEIWTKNNEFFDGIYSGYVASKHQIDIISDFTDKFRKSYTKVLVDPVMGDNGEIYPAYTTEVCRKMCNLAKAADLITPNLTELCILADIDYSKLISNQNSSSYFETIAKTAQKIISHQNQTVVVTGILKGAYIYNGVFSKKENVFIKCEKYGNSFTGTGDLFASVLCGSMLNGIDIVSAVDKASKFISASIKDTMNFPFDRNHGVNFEKYLYTLAKDENK